MPSAGSRVRPRLGLRSASGRGTVEDEVRLFRNCPAAVGLAALFMGLAACPSDKSKSAADSDDASEGSAIEKADPPPEPDPGPGVRDDGTIVSAVQWFDGPLDAALRRAGEEDKLVFVDVGAYWCPPCHELDEKVFTKPEIGEFLGHGYVAVHIDAEKGDGPELVDRYHVQAFPTLLVLEPTGVEKGRVVDYVPPEELRATLLRIAAGGNVLGELEQAVEASPDDLQARYRLGHALALAAQSEAAKKHFDAILLADPHNEMGLASKVEYDRALFLQLELDRDPKAAIETWRTLQRRYPDSKEATRSHRMIGRALHELGRDEEAMQSLDRMLAEDPTDPQLAASYGWFSFRQKVGMNEALKVVEAALEKSPTQAELHYLRAELQHLLGDDAQALASMREASEAEPKSGYYKRQVKRFEELVGA